MGSLSESRKADRKTMADDDFCNKPLAARGLTSYRYRGRYGWIMIGARDHAARAQGSRAVHAGRN